MPACPYCHTSVKPGALAETCPHCSTAHHAECWTENDGCAIPGCEGRPPDDAVAADPAAPESADPPAAAQAAAPDPVLPPTKPVQRLVIGFEDIPVVPPPPPPSLPVPARAPKAKGRPKARRAARPPKPPKPARTPSQPRRIPVAGIIIAAIALAVAIVAITLYLIQQSQPPKDPIATEAMAAGATGAPDGGRTGASRPSAATPSSPPPSGSPSGPSSGSGSRKLQGLGYTMSAPGPGWAIGVQRLKGAQRTRRLAGPSGDVIRIVHTPNHPAEPDPSRVETDVFLASNVESLRRIELSRFPTEECRDRVCVDYVLNDPEFGGLAILANGERGSRVEREAQRLAFSVRPR